MGVTQWEQGPWGQEPLARSWQAGTPLLRPGPVPSARPTAEDPLQEVLGRAMPSQAGPCRTVPHHARLCRPLPCRAMLSHAVPDCWAVLCHAVPGHAAAPSRAVPSAAPPPPHLISNAATAAPSSGVLAFYVILISGPDNHLSICKGPTPTVSFR